MVPKRPAVISAVVTPAAPANTRPKRATSSGNSSISTSAEIKQQPKAQPQQQPQQQRQQQQEQLSQAAAVPSDVGNGAGHSQKASEKGAAAAALQQEHQPRRSDARKLEQMNGGASLSQPRGYLQAARNAGQASAPKQSLVEEFPALNGSKDRRKEAPVQDEKHALSVPPGLHAQNSTAERQSSAKGTTDGSSGVSVDGGKSERGDGEGNVSGGRPAAGGNGHASDTASGADKDKSRKKRNRRKGGSGAGPVGAS